MPRAVRVNIVDRSIDTRARQARNSNYGGYSGIGEIGLRQKKRCRYFQNDMIPPKSIDFKLLLTRGRMRMVIDESNRINESLRASDETNRFPADTGLADRALTGRCADSRFSRGSL